MRSVRLDDEEEAILAKLIKRTRLSPAETLRRACRHSFPLFNTGAVDMLTLEPSKEAPHRIYDSHVVLGRRTKRK